VVAETAVRRALLGAGLCAAVLVAATAAPARAADECNGLQVCLPVAGPWVAVARGGAEYELQCPRRGYVVGGTDVRLASREIDVSFHGRTGSPIGPGVTTRDGVLFSAIPTGATPTSFRPFVGCIPTRGGGGRSQTGVAAPSPPGGLRPTRPLTTVVVTRSLAPGSSVVRARCPAGARLLGGAHAVAFRVEAPPSAAVLAGVHATRTITDAVVVRVSVSGAAAGARPEVQVRALCRSAP
jgi:hypothetical protein